MLECVINISEGRDLARVERIASAAGSALLDVHSDPHHHRSVLTVIGADAARAVASATVAELDLQDHDGVHPRLGVLDVVPFVALGSTPATDAVDARDGFALWLSATHGVPCFLYGPDRTLPEVRRHAFGALAPQTGPSRPHPTAGATAVGQRDLLIAYNIVLRNTPLDVTRQIAAAVRGPGVRTLGLAVGDRTQVSMNLTDPMAVGPAVAFDRVGAQAAAVGGTVERAELVGLVPRAVLAATAEARWAELDLDDDRTIEARLEASGLANAG